jgi:hypothetical protein
VRDACRVRVVLLHRAGLARIIANEGPAMQLCRSIIISGPQAGRAFRRPPLQCLLSTQYRSVAALPETGFPVRASLSVQKLRIMPIRRASLGLRAGRRARSPVAYGAERDDISGCWCSGTTDGAIHLWGGFHPCPAVCRSPPSKAPARRRRQFFIRSKLGCRNLIVMGVSRRPGERLDFGQTAAVLLDRAECSLMFVVSEQPTTVAETPASSEREPKQP